MNNIRNFAIILFGACFVAACGPVDDEYIQDYRRDSQLTVMKDEVVLSLNVAEDGLIPAEEKAGVMSYLHDFAKKGEGLLEIQVPYNERAERVFRSRAISVAKELVRLGVNQKRLSARLYDRDVYGSIEDVLALPVYLSYQTYKVKLPRCGDYTGSIGDNQSHRKFGCSIQRNLGLMVSNPKDLIKMRDSSGRSSDRALKVGDDYATGVISGAELDSAISTATDN